MNVKLEGAQVKVDVVRLDSEAIDEHLRSAAAVLCEILNDDNSNDTEGGGEDNFSRGGEEGHPCKRCGKLYKSVSTLNIHLRLKHPDDILEARCNACDKSYASNLSLQKHVRYMHQYEHRCRACYRTFASANALQQHGETCVKIETPCPACGKIYNSPLSLRNHIKYKHPKEKTHLCNVCRRTFTSSRGLANHTASMHPMSIDCNQCNKTFNSVGTLQGHFLDKHAEKSARCTLCRKVLASRGNLSRHLTKIHGIATIYTEDKYSCKVCTLSFPLVNDLIQHVMANCLQSRIKNS